MDRQLPAAVVRLRGVFVMGLALARLLRDGKSPPSARCTLHGSGAYGVALVGADRVWPEACRRYAAGIDARPADRESEFAREKDADFASELGIVETLVVMVTSARTHADARTMRAKARARTLHTVLAKKVAPP